MTDTNQRNTRKQRQGTVVSNVQDKTIVVRVDRRTTHPLYGKSLRVSKKYHVHDESNEANVGDTVLIVETRPLSKLKHWRLAEILERAR
jgi:small subunit ribosomal protein S17